MLVKTAPKSEKSIYFSTKKRTLFFIGRHFEYCCIYCKRVIHLIPMSLVIGFYVDVVVKRWWAQFLLLPWPYDLAMLLSAYTTTGAASTAYTASVKSRLKAVVRYANLTYILLMRRLNSRVANQFPVDQTLLAIGTSLHHRYPSATQNLI